MQEDMHYYGIYALARAAGINPSKSRLLAHSSQFVDDATEDGAMLVDDGTVAILPTTTSHKALDVKNAIPGDQWKVWVPFHFLPDCATPQSPFDGKMICSKDNRIARDLLANAVAVTSDDLRPYATGIALHAFADTYSHHGFWGYATSSNRVKEDSVELAVKSRSILKYLERKFQLFANRIVGTLAEAVPVGHGSVATYPDRPYLRWEFEYEHHDKGHKQTRDNPADYLEACKEIYSFMKNYLASFPASGDLSRGRRWGDIRPTIARLIHTEGTLSDRIGAWWEAITSGSLFPALEEDLVAHYDEKAWKHSHVDLARDEVALFYRAAFAHRNLVLHELLPRYGVLVAD